MSSPRQTRLLTAIAMAASLAMLPLQAQAPSGGSDAKGAPRLLDTIEAPILYLTLGANAGEPQAGEPQGRTQRHSVQRLLADPAFDTLFGGAVAGGGSGTETSSTRALALVRGVLGRSSGELEIALTGVVPRGGQPLLVLRAQLQVGEAERLQGALSTESAGLARPHRVLNGRQTYAMLGADGHGTGEVASPGEQVELALVGHDLVVANDGTAIEELLAPDLRTSATRKVLSSDPRYLRLQSRLEASAGSLVVYGDWPRLGQRLDLGPRREAGADGRAPGVPAFVLQWSGLGSARAVMASLSCADDDFTGTVLLDFDVAAEPRPARGDRRWPRQHQGGLGIDGWFASALSIPARTLVQDLPGGGLGGLVLAVDLRDIAQRSHRGAELLHHLRDSFEDFGLDFERNVLSRLGERGTAQLLFRRVEGQAPTEIASIYAVGAISRKAASDLFTDLRRAAEQHGTGRLLPGRPRRSTEILELRPHPAAPPTLLAVDDASILVAFDVTTIDDYLVETKKAQKHRGKRDATVSRAIQKIGGNEVAGLFDLDFTPWFDRIGELLRARKVQVDLSGLPRRHVGFLDLQPRENGLVLRVSVLSSR
ncbi:MAG: hypothetical protein KDC98_07810 [Planctomycetes bacterium]|nr:hypothetical protein [Planctomycetota bacterium]